MFSHSCSGYLRLNPNMTIRMEWDNFAALQVTSYDHWWNQQIGFKARNKAKQALKKGVEVREVAFDDELVKGIWEVYNESPVRQGAPNKHYGKSVDTVHREEATFLDSSVFIGAFLENKLIGFIKMVQNEAGTQAGLMNIVSMVRTSGFGADKCSGRTGRPILRGSGNSIPGLFKICLREEAA